MADGIIDPNFLYDKLYSGSSKRGPLAFAEQASIIQARNLQSAFQFGQQAKDIRSRESDSSIAVNNSNIAVNNANIKASESTTAGQWITNRLRDYDFEQTKIAQAGVAELINLGNRAVAEKSAVETEGALRIAQDPGNQQMIANIAGQNLQLAVKKNEHALNASSLDIANTKFELEKAISLQSIERANLTRNATVVANGTAVHNELNSMRVRDAQVGNSNATISYIDNVLKGNPQKAMDGIEAIEPALAEIEGRLDLGQPQRERLQQLKASMAYSGSTQKLGAIIGSGYKAAEAGQLQGTDLSLVNNLKSIGVDPRDVSSMKNLQITDTGTNGAPLDTIVVRNTQSNTSFNIARSALETSQVLPDLMHSVKRRDLNAQNPFTAKEEVTKNLARIVNHPLTSMVQQSYSELTDRFSGEINDAAVAQIGNVFVDMQQDLVDFNPLYQERYAKFANEGAQIFGAGLKTPLIKEELDKNPSLRQQLINSYNNRATGGLPIGTYMRRIKQIEDIIVATNPGRYSAARGQGLAAKEARQLLRQKAMASIPKIQDFPTTVKDALGIKDNGVPLRTSGILRSIGNFLTGTDVPDNMDLAAVNESEIAPLTVDPNA